MKRWPTKPLGEICVVDWGNTNLTKSAYVEGGRYLAVSAAGCDGRIDHKEHKKHTPVLSAIGAQCGRMFLPEEDFTAIKNTITLTPREGVCTDKFLYQLLTYVELPKRGAAQPFISKGDIQTFQVPVPPVAEQQRIVKLLEEAGELRKLRAQADSRISKLASALFYEFFGDPITNPKGFPRKYLGELVEFIGGSQPPRSTFSYEPSPDNIRLVQIRDFKSEEHKTYIPKSLARRFFEKDDVMIGRYGPPLFQILRGLSGSYNVALIKAVPRGEVTKDFIFQLLQEQNLHSTVIANSVRTAGQTGIKLDLLENYPAFLPPLSLQNEFAQRVTEIRELEDSQATSRTRLDALFQSMLHRAFNGEL